MRFAIAFVTMSAVISAVPAAMIFQRQSIPSCATTCIANADLGGCQMGDDSCLCHNEAFINSTTTCIQSTCTGQDLQTAEYDAQQLCLAVDVTLTASSPSSSASPTTSNSSAPNTASTKNNGAVSNSINILAGAAAVALGAALL